MKLQRNLAGLLSTLLVVVLGASSCGGLGEGSRPEDAVLLVAGGVEDAPTAKVFTCVNASLALYIDFSNGSRGDFTSRATYSSSNPSVAQVSNFDIAVPEQTNTFYNRGAIVAVSPGTATITAKYLSFTRSVVVTVSDITNFQIVPATVDLAANSQLDLAVTADLDGVTTAIDTVGVSWSFVTPNTAVATIEPNEGTVTGVSAGSALTARAHLPACNRNADAQVTVANLQSLALSREFGDEDRLVVGNTERLIATGTLDNGATQNLTAQVSYGTSDAAAVSLATSGVANLTRALVASAPVQLTASFANPAVMAPAITITPVADSLNTIAVTPASSTTAAGALSQFNATGSYASGLMQDVTRHVTWTSSDTSVASIRSSSASTVDAIAGLVQTSSSAGGKTVTLTAATTNGAAQAVTASGTLTLQ